MHNFLFGRTKALHYHHFPSQGGAHVGVMMILHGKDCNELHIAQNVCVFDCNIYIVVKSGWGKSCVQLPLGTSELGKVQMVDSRTAQRKKMNPQLLFWLQWSQRGLFHFCFGTWHGPGDAGAAQKGQILQLAPAENGKTKGGDVDVGSQPSDTWHSFGTWSPAAQSDPLKMLWELHPKEWPLKPLWEPHCVLLKLLWTPL